MKKILMFLGGLLLASAAHALSDDARVPILLYHTSWAKTCDAASNDVLALERDLELLHENGWSIVSVDRLHQWSAGLLDGKELPDRVVGITIDDGYDSDWLDNVEPEHPCAPLKSARSVVEAFVHKHSNQLAPGTPHITLFVIASPVARSIISPQTMRQSWWAEAAAHPNFSVQSHGTDHDFKRIEGPLWDEAMQLQLPTAATDDGIYVGKMRPDRHISKESNTNYIARASEYIQQVTGVRPTMLAYPVGRYSTYTLDTYLPRYKDEHGIEAAFCTTGKKELYLRRDTHPYCIPRFTYKYNFTSAEQLLELLATAEARAAE